MTQNRETLLALARGIGIGLAAFAAWVSALVAIVLAIHFAEYWVWALFPAAFIAGGIRYSLDRRATKGPQHGAE